MSASKDTEMEPGSISKKPGELPEFEIKKHALTNRRVPGSMIHKYIDLFLLSEKAKITTTTEPQKVITNAYGSIK